MENECNAINPIFFKYIKTKLPYVVMKSAMTLDGKISAYTGDSKWVTNEKSRQLVHQLRHKLKGIMVGINTILTDNPQLNCRIENCVNPIKIIVDSNLKIPLNSNVLKLENNNKCIVATTTNCDKNKKKQLIRKGIIIIETKPVDNKVDLNELMFKLGKMEIDSILLEGGGSLNFSMLQNKLIDKVMFFIAPKIIGGHKAKTPVEGFGIPIMNDAINIKNIKLKNIGTDILIIGDLR